MYKKVLFFFFVILVASCHSPDTTETVDFIIPDSIFAKRSLSPIEKSVDEIISSIASPIEMSVLLSNNKIPFSLKYIYPIENINEYKTNYKKAIAFGILLSDLGYMSIYNKIPHAFNCVTQISNLADRLKIQHFYDVESIKKLISGSKKIDSLLYVTISGYNRMNTVLLKNKRRDICALIASGVWIENLYFATQIVKENPNKNIIERIGEQKLILSQLVIILKTLDVDKNITNLINNLEDLKKDFAEIKISYILEEPEPYEKNNKLIIVPNEISVVEIPKKNLTAIIEKVEDIRNNLIWK
jgi:hypothetical protein